MIRCKWTEINLLNKSILNTQKKPMCSHLKILLKELSHLWIIWLLVSTVVVSVSVLYLKVRQEYPGCQPVYSKLPRRQN